MPPITVDVTPSQRLRAFHLVFTLLALLALPLSAIPLWLQVALACAVVGYALSLLRCKTPTRVSFDGGWHWHTPDTIEPMWLVRASVWPVVIVLSFRNPAASRWSPQGWRRLVLLPDSVSKDDWRRLRIALRYFAVLGEQPAPSLD